MKAYPDYKDSGIEWIGDVPEHWDNWKVSRAFEKISSGTTPKSGDPKYHENGIINWINTGDLNDGILNSCKKKITTKALEDHSTLKIYPPNSLIVAMYGATIGKTSITTFEATTNQACCVLPNSTVVDTRFAFYWFIANKQHIINMSFGGGQPNISQDLIKNLRISAPLSKEQTAIANFLDHKTTQIDLSIEKRRELIDLLKEHRAALINEAVTKGINRDAPMKDSGIEWIGEVPEHWALVTMKFIADLKSGDSITSETIKKEGSYPVYGGNGLRGYTDNYTHEGLYVLIGRQGALCGNINYADNRFWASEHAVVCTLKGNYEASWFGELLRTMNLNQYSVSAAQPGLSVDRIKNLKIPVPPTPEQNQITKYITSETTRIDDEIQSTQKEIDLLEEYRQSLIAEAVTGKIDVRDYPLN